MVLGLTGKEQIITINYITFCNLCQRKINKDEQCIALSNDHKWVAHCDCSLVIEREHKVDFLKYTKLRKAKSKKLKRNR